MKTLLVTGANGFTGRHFIHYVKSLNLNINIVGIDIKDKSFDKSSKFKFIRCDLLNRSRINNIIRKERPDYIFHFAGIIFSNNYKKLLNYNVFTTLNLLDAVVKNKKKCAPRILNVGSSAEYGVVQINKQPISECIPLKPVTPYGISKAAQDLLALQYHFQQGLYIVIARPFNIIGPGQTDRFVCGSLVRQIKNINNNKNKKFIIGNLLTKRDFIDIRDVVRAYWMLLMSKKEIAGEVFNIGSGMAYSIRRIVNILLKYHGEKIEVEQRKERIRINDIPSQRADIEKIKKLINWSPMIPIQTSLKDMLDVCK